MTINNITHVSESYLCSNCGACSAICTKNAISFKWTSVGRLYASVDDNCINCGICTRVCPSLNNHEGDTLTNDGEILSTIISRSSNSEIYSNSQSGGMATSLLSYLFNENHIQGAIVCRMEYGKTPQVRGTIISSKEDLKACQKSCYTPVDLLYALKEVSNIASVAIVGLPCHIEGLVRLQKLNKKFCNVKYKIGLICDRTLCAGIQNVFASLSNADKIKIHWRKKDFHKEGQYYSYENAPVVIFDQSGNETVVPNYYRFSLKDMFTSPRCRICNDKLNLYSDLVLGDPWGMEGADMVHGDSLVLVRTELGRSIIQDTTAKSYVTVVKESSYKEVLKGQGILMRRQNSQNYRAALSRYVDDIDSFPILRHIKDLDKSKVEQAGATLFSFFESEKLNEKNVVSLAYSKIDATKRAINGSKIRKALSIIKQKLGL